MDALKLNYKKFLKGFTLLELIVVIIILGILAAIAIPIYTNSVEQRRGEICINNMRTIFAAWRIYNIREVTNYDPGGASTVFQTVSQINTTLGSFIDERNFGRTSDDVYGYYVNYYPPPTPPALTPAERYRIYTYRLSGIYEGRYIQCYYYPNGLNGDGTGSTYDWSTSGATPWPWMPIDE